MTKVKVEDEAARLMHMHVKKKVHADTIVATTHFIKKAVIVPNGYESDSATVDRPFARGIMAFDDYNYK